MAPLKGELAAAQPLTEGFLSEIVKTAITPPALRATSPFRGGWGLVEFAPPSLYTREALGVLQIRREAEFLASG